MPFKARIGECHARRPHFRSLVCPFSSRRAPPTRDDVLGLRTRREISSGRCAPIDPAMRGAQPPRRFYFNKGMTRKRSPSSGARSSSTANDYRARNTKSRISTRLFRPPGRDLTASCGETRATGDARGTCAKPSLPCNVDWRSHAFGILRGTIRTTAPASSGLSRVSRVTSKRRYVAANRA